jgi:hypothetical protein
MTTLPWTRRSAERFDALVGDGSLDHVDVRTSELLELVGALRSVPAPEARPEFVTGLRERLMLAAASELTAAPAARDRDAFNRLTVKPARTRRERRVGIALGAVAIVGATTSMAVASQSAIPGDTLYPLKRAIENTQAGFSVGDDAKGKTLLDNASGRLAEVDELTSTSDPDAGLVTETLETFTIQAGEAGDLLIADYQENGHEQSIEQVHEFATESLTALSALAESVPASAHDALLAAAQAVFALDADAEAVCPQCGDPVLEVPEQLLAGATTGLDQPGQTDATIAGGELSGITPAQDTPAAAQHPQDGGKDDGKPSGLNPPASPVAIPSTAPSSSGGEQPGGLGDVLPSVGTGANSGGQGGHGGGHNGGGKGDNDADLGPVTGTVNDTVNDVVTGVVEGVNGLLNGLSGEKTSGK